MIVDIALIRKGDLFVPFSIEDRHEGMNFPERVPIMARLSAATNPRSLLELRGFFGSCKYIADLNLNDNMNSKLKVSHLTKLKCNFVDGTVFDERGLLHWMVRSLSYANCHQPDAHKFIAKAFEEHAALVGIYDVDEYLRLLREQ